MISEQLLAMLRCPETRVPLKLAAAPLVAALNARIARGELKNRAGDIVQRPFDGGLLRQDHALVYPIIDRIPVLLIDEAIPLEQLPPDQRPRES